MINCIPFRKACTGLPEGMHLISEKCALCKRNIQYRSVNEICAEGARNHGLLNVPTDGFFNTTHILPTDIKEQIIIAAFLSLIQGKLEKAQTLLDELTRLRNGLMQKLFI